MNTKAKGNRRERKTMDWLEAEGYACTRSAASLGCWDIVAISKTHIRVIQVKSNTWPGSLEMEAMVAFQCPAYVSKEIWRWDDNARWPRVRTL